MHPAVQPLIELVKVLHASQHNTTALPNIIQVLNATLASLDPPPTRETLARFQQTVDSILVSTPSSDGPSGGIEAYVRGMEGAPFTQAQVSAILSILNPSDDLPTSLPDWDQGGEHLSLLDSPAWINAESAGARAVFGGNAVIDTADFADDSNGFSHLLRVRIRACTPNELPRFVPSSLYETLSSQSRSADRAYVDICVKLSAQEVGRAQADICGSAGLTTGDLLVIQALISQHLSRTQETLGGSPLTHLVICPLLVTVQQHVAEAVGALHDPSANYQPGTVPAFPADGSLGSDLIPWTRGVAANSGRVSLAVVEDAARAAAVRAARGAECKVAYTQEVCSEYLLERYAAGLEGLGDDVLGGECGGGPEYEGSTALAPLFAFHGTWSGDAEASIVRSGIMADQEVTEDGILIECSSGQRYGRGVYVSPEVTKASWYTQKDANGGFTLFLALVAPGRSRRAVYNRRSARGDKKAEEAYQADLAAYFEFDPEMHANVSPNGWEVVVFDSCRVLPILLVTFVPDTASASSVRTTDPFAHVAYRTLESAGTVSKVRSSQWATLASMSARAASAAKRSTKKRVRQIAINGEDRYAEAIPLIDFQRVPGTGDKWLVELSPLLGSFGLGDAPVGTSPVKLILVIECSRALGTVYDELMLPAAAELVRRVGPSSVTVVLFDSKATLYGPSAVTSDAFFTRPDVKDRARSKGAAFGAAYAVARDAALDDLEAETQERERQAFAAARAWLVRQLQPGEEGPSDVQVRKKMKEWGNRVPGVSSTSSTYLFVTLSRGVDTTVRSDAELAPLWKESSAYIGASGMSAGYWGVNIGTRAKTEHVLAAKAATQTMVVYDTTPLYFVRRAQSVFVQMRKLASKLLALSGQLRVEVEVDPEEWDVSTGFMTSFVSRLQSSATVSLAPGAPNSVLYHGLLPPRMCRVRLEKWRWVEVPIRAQAIDQRDPRGSAGLLMVTESSVLWSASVEKQGRLLSVLRSLVDDLKVAAIRGKDVGTPFETFAHMVVSIKGAGKSVSDLVAMDAQTRIQVAKRKARLVNELESLANDVRNALAMAAESKMDVRAQNRWLSEASSLKYGLVGLRRAAGGACGTANVVDGGGEGALMLGEDLLARYTGASDAVEDRVTGWEEQCELAARMEASTLSAMSERGMRDSLRELFTVPDVLFGFGFPGLAIAVERNAAAVVDPWQIQVEEVSNEWVDTVSVMCGLRTGGGRETDVLVVVVPGAEEKTRLMLRSRLHSAYLGVVFARNPLVAIKGQSSALLMVALVRAVTQLMEGRWLNRDSIASVFAIWSTLRWVTGSGGESYWTQLLSKLGHPSPGRHMTEAAEDDVGSVVKLLAPLMVCLEAVEEGGLFRPSGAGQLEEVAMALLAEAVSRGARVYLKRKLGKAGMEIGRNSMREMAGRTLRKGLGIRVDSIPRIAADDSVDPPSSEVEFSSEVDTERAFRASGKFFFAIGGMTNVSPFAVLACLRFASILQRALAAEGEVCWGGGFSERVVETVLSEFDGMGMREFVVDFVGEGDSGGFSSFGHALQVALYAQGMWNHSSVTRRGGLEHLGDDPSGVVGSVAALMRQRVYEENRQVKMARLARERKVDSRALAREKKAAKQREFLETHGGAPRVFSESDVDAMIRTGMEVTRESTGLLRHRCCFPLCPLYLEDLSTQEDRVLGTRKGIMKHLSGFFYPRRMWISNAHGVGRVEWRKWRRRGRDGGREGFVGRMVELTGDGDVGFWEGVWEGWWV